MRISATELDAHRLYKQEDWMSFEMLVERLRGEGEESPAMRAGSAFHTFMENTKPTGDAGLHRFTQDGITFTLDLNAEVSLPVVREIKAEETFSIAGMPVTLVGKADCVHGRVIDDHKLTANFDAEKYADAWQWRAYLMLFRAWQFRYNIFVARDESDTEWTIKEFHRMSFYRYEGMEAEVLAELRELALFIRDYVPERINEPEDKKLPAGL